MKLKILTLTGLFLIYATTANAFWPVVPAPPQSSQNALADEVIVNGIEMQIINFQSRLTMREVLSFYRNKWMSKFAESESAPWKQISQMKGDYFITVQVKDEGLTGSSGRINIAKAPAKIKKLGEGMPMMESSEPLNEIITKDKLTISTMFLLVNKHSVDMNTQFYERHYKNLGWKKAFSKDLQSDNAGVSLSFIKGNEEITVTINKDTGNGATVLVNKIVKKSWYN